MAPDLAARVVPFLLLAAAVHALWRPRWLGLGVGDPGAQLTFGLAALPALFAGAAGVQRHLARRRGGLRVPAGPGDLLLQTAFYAVNAAAEEAFFRGLLQGGIGAALGPPLGLLVGTLAYVLYHRLGGWAWPDVLATSLVGVPLALAYNLLPGPPSLLGVGLAHFGATCGFLGPGPWLLHRLRLLGA